MVKIFRVCPGTPDSCLFRQERRAEGILRQLAEFIVAEPEDLLRELIFARQRGVEHVGIVSIQRHQHAGIEQLSQWMLLDRGTTSGEHVAGNADLDGNLSFRQMPYQFCIFDGMQSVADAVGFQFTQRPPDRFRPHRLAGMDGPAQAVLRRQRIHLAKLFRRLRGARRRQCRYRRRSCP